MKNVKSQKKRVTVQPPTIPPTLLVIYEFLSHLFPQLPTVYVDHSGPKNRVLLAESACFGRNTTKKQPFLAPLLQTNVILNINQLRLFPSAKLAPFQIRFLSDAFEFATEGPGGMADGTDRGFKLSYMQDSNGC